MYFLALRLGNGRNSKQYRYDKQPQLSSFRYQLDQGNREFIDGGMSVERVEILPVDHPFYVTDEFGIDRAMYLGFFENGFFRDRSGDAVAFIRGAQGEPHRPKQEITGDDLPDPQPFPIKFPNFKGQQPGSSPYWSGMTWEQFLPDE